MDKIDQRNRLEEEIFTYRVAKNGNVFISWHGRQVTILKGKAAERFRVQIEGLDHFATQLVMAKVTGNFKRGNERMSKEQGKD